MYWVKVLSHVLFVHYFPSTLCSFFVKKWPWATLLETLWRLFHFIFWHWLLSSLVFSPLLVPDHFQSNVTSLWELVSATLAVLLSVSTYFVIILCDYFQQFWVIKLKFWLMDSIFFSSGRKPVSISLYWPMNPSGLKTHLTQEVNTKQAVS